MAQLSTDIPDDASRAEIVALAEDIEATDGAPPLSDQSLTHLRSPAVRHVTARDAGTLLGYAQRDGDTAEIAGQQPVLAELLDAVTAPRSRIWTHGRGSRLVPVLRERGFQPARELFQLRRPLDSLPPDPPLADGVVVRAFEPDRDEDAWLEVNAAAFASHPEQGKWTREDLDARTGERWFDPAGFLLAERDETLLGYHWTKVHPPAMGEVYVLGISPKAQGLGLGKGLLWRGLRYLADRGCDAVLLYTDEDNSTARRLYESAGFTEYDLDVQWQAPATV